MQARLPDGSVIISGVLGRDAEYRQVGQNNSSLTKFSVKVGERPPKASGERGEAIWVNCQCWHSVARAVMCLKKFDTVFCVGKIDEHEYEGKKYKNLICELVLPMPSAALPSPAQPAPQGMLPDDLGGFEEILTDEGTPF